MNFLAHSYLSGKNELLLLGNFIGDSVKGSMLNGFPDDMKKGIQLHRFIDHYTDHHEVVEETKQLLRPGFGKYAPVVADVYFDHFLASRWEEFHHETLEKHILNVHNILESNFALLPEKAQLFIPFLIRQNWMKSYATIEGISEVLIRMSRRTRFNSGMEKAQQDLRKNYQQYNDHFTLFFPDLINATKKQIDSLS